MASGSTLKAFQSQYQSLQTLCCTYDRVHGQLIRALRTSLTLLGRLNALARSSQGLGSTGRHSLGSGLDRRATYRQYEDKETMGDGDNAENDGGRGGAVHRTDRLTPLLIQKTLARLERVVHVTIPDILNELETVTRSMQTVKRQAQELKSRLRKSTSEAMMAYRMGPIPSISQCVDGVVDIVDMHTRETKLCELISGKERGWLDGVSYMCLNDDDGFADGRGESASGGAHPRQQQRRERHGEGNDSAGTLLEACTELVEALACLEGRKAHAAQIETMHVVLATVEV